VQGARRLPRWFLCVGAPAPCDRALQDAWLTEKIREIHATSDGTYGSLRIHAELRLGHGIGKKRVERLMRAAGLSGEPKRRRGRTTVRLPGVRVAPDLVERDFDPDGPDQTWAADITEIPTWEGKLYLAHVQDLFSRRIVGWAMAAQARADQPPPLAHQGRGTQRDLRVHRRLVQPAPAALHARLPLAARYEQAHHDQALTAAAV
jgi:hypothetical protein